jgi:hypothetical protein
VTVPCPVQIAPRLAVLCVVSALGNAAAGAPSFKNDVQPVFDANCVSCHQEGGAQQGLVLESGKSHAAIVGRPSSEAHALLVAPSAPDSSYLFAKILGTHVSAGGRGARMPLGGALSGTDVETIRGWIAGGAKDN